MLHVSRKVYDDHLKFCADKRQTVSVLFDYGDRSAESWIRELYHLRAKELGDVLYKLESCLEALKLCGAVEGIPGLDSVGNNNERQEGADASK